MKRRAKLHFMQTEKQATEIVKRLKEKGHVAYFAGGFVRDKLMKHPSDDIDIATTASVEEMQALFERTIPVGVAFGIVIVVMEGHQFEVATFRKERGYLDGRRPTTIEPASPKEDALRRDFTINGMFYDPTTDELFDYVGGQDDIKKEVVRAIGNPHDRFLEDRLRMMRAVRYSTRFDFAIEPKTVEAICDHAKSLLPAVAMERVWQEFKKMSQFAHFDKALVMLHELGLLQTIFPSLNEVSTATIIQRTAHIERFPKEAPALAELLELFPDHSLDDLLELCDYLKLSNTERDFIRFHHHVHSLFEMPHDWQEKLEAHEWAAFYATEQSALMLQIVAAHFTPEDQTLFLKEHARRQKALQNAIERIRTHSPLIRAEHLIKEGVSPGRQMGLLLKEAERIAVNDNLNSVDEVMKQLKQSNLWIIS